MCELHADIISFIENCQKTGFEMLNEASLQNELAFFLKNSNRGIVQLERNVRLDFPHKNTRYFIKKEMDIYIRDPEKKLKHCIEIKFPPGKSFKKRLFNTMKDLKLMEQLNDEGFDICFLFFITKHKYYKDKLTSVIQDHHEYAFKGVEKEIRLKKSYDIDWRTTQLKNEKQESTDFHYFILAVQD